MRKPVERGWLLRVKIVHRAAHVTSDGRVSAICYKKPRAIDLSVASWTIRDEAVTCPKCKRIVQAAGAIRCQEGSIE